MKSNFRDPLAVKEGKKIKSPWNFDQPAYDERTSCYVNAGSHYGVGHKQPIGSMGISKAMGIPKGRVKTMEVDEVPRKNIPVEIQE